MLTKTIRDVLMKINLKNPRRLIQTSQNAYEKEIEDSDEGSSDSS